MLKHPRRIRYEATKLMRRLSPRGVWRIKSAEDQARWTRLGPKTRMELRTKIHRAKMTPGTIAWLMEQAVLPPRPRR